MSKKLFILTFIGLISATSAYSKCEGGTEITNTTGTTFCKSNVGMNWWSAAAWCKANGLQLATMYEMCPNWDGNIGEGKCPGLSTSGSAYWLWSATIDSNNSEIAFRLDTGYGLIGDSSKNSDCCSNAFCR